MNEKVITNDNHIDDHVDEEIKKCFDKDKLRSFFTFAGAGSGKTRSLVNTLTHLDSYMGLELEIYSKQIAVITYTNAACDEILRRVDYKPIFAVSTIHSFLWELIKNQQRDIKKWVKNNIVLEIKDLETKQLSGRSERTSIERAKKIESKKKRLSKIEIIKRFSYNPNGENLEYDSLNHAEVIKMGSEFIMNSETMQKILISRYPILLIDESQDTKKELIDSLLSLYENHKTEIVIGMFGDTMQKIYTDGKDNLSLCIPDDWKKPVKVMNHRSSRRIVALANAIRKGIDGQVQNNRSDAEPGIVRLFIANRNNDKAIVEKRVADDMAEITGDKHWLIPNEYKSLILEHHMAGSRLGFFDLFSPLYAIDSFKTGILDGTLPEIRLFTKMILPLVNAYQSGNKFEVSKIIRQYSPLLNKKAFLGSNNQVENLIMAERAVNDLCSLWDNKHVPTCLEVLKKVEKGNLFEITNRLQGITQLKSEDSLDNIASALLSALSVSFDQMKHYNAYINGETSFATHQGIKGLEFPRVVVIIDDEEARGFLFSYEKLFGAKAKTKTDLDNERQGKDTSISRTKRLFYVACTRAQKSLAIIAYTNNVNAVKDTAIRNAWFLEDEIIPFE
ncbi:MAG: UvrD-helicase domain-containing protein [Eubacteriales bacterium]